MQPNPTYTSSEPLAKGTFSQEREFQKRLKRVPLGCFPPVILDQRSIVANSAFVREEIVPGRSQTVRRRRWANEPEGIKQLLNEYEALRVVKHENVVALRRARRYVHSLWVTTSWRETLPQSTPHPLPWLLTRMLEATRGVAAIHRAGLVHGDLKPATILLGDCWTLIHDFKCAGPPGKREVLGYSPKYAAPEVVLSEQVGPAADIYALGMTLYMLFIKDRFPLILRGADARAGEAPATGQVFSQEEDSTAALSPITSFRISSEIERPLLAPKTDLYQSTRPPKSAPMFTLGPDFIIGIKVRFRSQLSRVLEGVQYAGCVGEILRLVRTATQIDPSERFKSCEELETALQSLLTKLPNNEN